MLVRASIQLDRSTASEMICFRMHGIGKSDRVMVIGSLPAVARSVILPIGADTVVSIVEACLLNKLATNMPSVSQHLR